MVDVKAWAELTKIIQQARPKPPAAHKKKPKKTAQRKLTDFERNTHKLRSAVSALKPKSPVPPVSLRT